MSETSRRLQAFAAQLPAPPEPPPPPGWGAQFASSALRAGTSDLVGLPGTWTQGITGVTPEQNDQWRRENLLASLGSQVAGAIGPYGLATNIGLRLGARALPGLFSAERLAAAPVTVAAQRGAVAEIPFAAARTIASPILGGDVEQTALNAGLDIALGGAIGGGVGFLWGRRASNNTTNAGQEQRLAEMVPAYDMQLPAQERLKILTGLRPGAAEGPMATLVPDMEQQLRRQIRMEEPTGVPRLTIEGRSASESGDLLSDVYGSGRDVAARRIGEASTKAYRSPTEWQEALRATGLPENWETVTQFPRILEPKSEEAAKRLFARFNGNLTAAHDNWFIGRGMDPDGMFVIARRIGSGPPSINDRWFTGFTNRPSALVTDLPMMERADRLGRFFSGVDRTELNKRVADTAKVDPTSAISLYDDLEKAYPARLEQNARTTDSLRLLPEWTRNLAKEYQPGVNQLWTHAKGVIAPGQQQFNNQPLARNVLFKSAAIYDRGKERVGRVLFGESALQGRSPAAAIGLPGRGQSGGVRAAWEALEESDIQAFARTVAKIDPNGKGLKAGARGQDFETALRAALGDLSDNAQAARVGALIRAAKAANDGAFAHNNLVRQTLGMTEIKALDNRVLPHYWGGSHRWRLLNADGNTEYMAWGRTTAELNKHADDAAARLGLTKDPKGGFVSGRAEDLDEALLMRRRPRVEPTEVGDARTPEILGKQRRGVGGYMLDPDGPLPNKSELWQIIQSGVEQTEMNAADLTVKQLLGPRLADIRAAYGPDVSNQVLRRLQQMSGTQGAFSAWQNKAVEKVLGTGKNGATKLAGNLNRVESMFALTFFNFGYAAINAATPLVSLAPKLALLNTVPVENLGRYFDTMMTYGENGAQGFLNLPNPMKLMKDGWRAMRQPTQMERGMFERALREQVIAPKFIEQEVGLKSNRAVTLQRIAKGEDSLYETAMNFIETPTRVIEEMTRAHAFATGLRTGQIIGFRDEALYQFAKEISNRTMYGYATQDRANLFQGPLGNVAGLFKNWMLHHIGDWSAYAGEAVRRGNFKPLLWVGTSTAALGGLGALPFVQGLDRFQRWTGDAGVMQSMYSAMNGEQDPWLADAAFYGVPGLFGTSLQGTASAPFADPTRDIAFMFNVAALNRAQAIGQLGAEAINTWRGVGGNPLQNERVWDRMWYAMTPRTMYRAMAQVEDGALKALRNGAPIYEGITFDEYFRNTFGFTPTVIARAWEANSRAWENRDRMARATGRYGEMLAQGIVQGNQRMVNDAIANATLAGVDLSRVMQSAQTRVRTNALPSVPMEYVRDPDSLEFMNVLGLLRER